MSMVLSERRGSIAILTLNNPERYNALGGSLLNDLNAALDEVLCEPRARAVVLTGAGKGFCSGAQFGGDTFGAGEGIAERMRGSINPVIEKIRNLPIPVVVAMNGAAAGAGVGIALAGDIVIAARSARFILSFVRLGAALDGGTSLFLQRSIGAARARALVRIGAGAPADTIAAVLRALKARRMIGPTGAVRVMVATKPVDFRKGADGLAALVPWCKAQSS